MERISVKGEAWVKFSKQVLDHIENYAVPQYGDLPDKMLEEMSVDDMVHDIKRYLGRIKSNVRKEEEKDLLKIAHYANLLMLKRKGEL